MAQVDDEILEEGAQIIWVLEADTRARPGTAASCLEFVRGIGGDKGICVGDSQTSPEPGTFDESPFAKGRGFDLIVPLESMVIEYVTTHGTPSGNENLPGQAVLEQVRRFTGR